MIDTTLTHTTYTDARAKRAFPRSRVVTIIDRLNAGGPTKHVTWLTVGLDAPEFAPALITGTIPSCESDMSYYARDAGIEPLVVKEMSRELSWRDFYVVWKLWRTLVRLRPRIVDTHKAKAGAVGRMAAMLYRWVTPATLIGRPRPCSVVHTFHGHVLHSYYGAAKSQLFIAIERMLARLATDRIIVVSEQQKREIHGKFGVGRAEQVRVVPYGIDFDEIRPVRGRLRSALGIDGDTPLVGIVGRLCDVKNHAMFLEAAARLRRQGVRAHFVIIGDGHLRSELEAQTRQLNLTDCVSFTGFRDDVTTLYGDLDVAALTSLNEGTPFTLIEAMSCGVAVATTAVGGTVDLLGSRGQEVDGYTQWEHGLTAPSRDVESYARALRRLLEDEELRRRLGTSGQSFIRARYSKERLICDIENLYREITLPQHSFVHPEPTIAHTKLKEEIE